MKEPLKQALAARRKIFIEDECRVPAAVMLPLYEDAGRWHVVFIRRTLLVPTHKGQISFPGGSRDACDDTLRDTALRESYEEIGLRPEDVEVLGELDDEVTTTSNYVVTPFVAAIPWPYRFSVNIAEVDEVLAAPLEALLDEACLAPATELLDGQVVESYAYHYAGMVIWGATARILYKFLGIITALPEFKPGRSPSG